MASLCTEGSHPTQGLLQAALGPQVVWLLAKPQRHPHEGASTRVQRVKTIRRCSSIGPDRVVKTRQIELDWETRGFRRWTEVAEPGQSFRQAWNSKPDPRPPVWILKALEVSVYRLCWVARMMTTTYHLSRGFCMFPSLSTARHQFARLYTQVIAKASTEGVHRLSPEWSWRVTSTFSFAE
jgi:hypothetical protein